MAMGAVTTTGAGNQGNPEVGVIVAAAIARGAGADESTVFPTLLVWG
jgi:hypothetical protein